MKLTLINLAISLFVTNISSASVTNNNATTLSEGCPNAKHVILSCKVEYDYCNYSPTFWGYLAWSIDTILTDLEICGTSSNYYSPPGNMPF